jgi:hypothetical protein
MGFIKNIDNRKHILIIVGAGGLGVAFLGIRDWLVPPSIHYESMPQWSSSPHALLGGVKQLHEISYPNNEAERAADRELVQRHSEEACKSIDLGRLSKEVMSNDVMANILTHLTEPVVPHYANQDGKAASYFLRLCELRTPTYEVAGELYGERKVDVDVLEVLT